MSWYTGIFDYINSLGTHKVTFIEPTPKEQISFGEPLPKDFDKKIKDYKKFQNQLNKQNYKALIKKFYTQIKDKKSLQKQLLEYRNNEVVETIIDVMIDDGLMSNNDRKIFQITYRGETAQEEVQGHIDSFVTKQKLDSVILDFIDEAIILGEYILPFDYEPGKGVTKIYDNPEMSDTCAIYEGQDLDGFLKIENGIVKEYDKDYAIHFLLSYKKVRVDVSAFTNYSEKYYLKKHIKIGESLIGKIIHKLKQLEIIEMANMALDLKRIMSPVMVMVGMPENTQTNDIGAIVEEYEKILSNIFQDISGIENLSFGEIMQMAGEIKVLPSIGNTKGSITTLDINADNSSGQEKSEAIKKAITLLLGIPFYYFSIIGENQLSRLESLKLFSRYSKKLNSMQDAIIMGVKRLIKIHLDNVLSFKVDIDDIHINMRQITNVELLDSMEYLVALIGALKEMIDVLNSVTEITEGAISINSKALHEFINKLLSEFPMCENLLIYNESVDKNQDKDDDGNVDNNVNNPDSELKSKVKGNLTSNHKGMINDTLKKLATI